MFAEVCSCFLACLRAWRCGLCWCSQILAQVEGGSLTHLVVCVAASVIACFACLFFFCGSPQQYGNTPWALMDDNNCIRSELEAKGYQANCGVQHAESGYFQSCDGDCVEGKCKGHGDL